MAPTPGSTKQLPDHAILDYYFKQTYLGNAFLVSTDLVATTTEETPLLYLSNPASNFNQNGQAGSLGLFQSVRKLQSDTLDAGVVFKFYLNPTGVSGGSPMTPLNLRQAWGTVSKMVATISPTVSDNGTFLSTFVPNLAEVDSSVMIILDPGYSILVTVSAAETSNAICELSWWEI